MESRRLNYLRALGIDVWERRDQVRQANGGQLRTAPAPGDSSQAQTEESDGTKAGGRDQQAMAGRQSARSAPPPAARSPQQPAAIETLAARDVSGLGWDELEATVRSCTACALHATRTQSVFGVGNRTARWMVVGEAPGADEDRQGEPFVGRAGQLLNSMLKAIGLEREQVFIANILKSRPPGNRDPRPEEVRACIPYLYRQIELIDPTLILCVGRIAAQTLLAVDTPIGKLRGKLHQLASGRPMIVTYHPAYLLRSPGEKRKAWADLVLAMQTFDQLANRQTATGS